MIRRAHLVITGAYRSGTTLVERLVDNLPEGFCAPQPFPYLYLAVKRRFLEESGCAVPQYPIGSGFRDPLHRPDQLASFLRSTIIDRDMIRGAFDAMRDYSGGQTPALADVVDELPEATLAEVVTAMHALLARSQRPAATVLGSKEVLLEEFVPSLTQAGIAALIVLRDPRHVAASTFGPGAEAWTGRARPLLYTVRLWRKSVAYALQHQPLLAAARMEDFVSDPGGTLERCLRALEHHDRFGTGRTAS